MDGYSISTVSCGGGFELSQTRGGGLIGKFLALSDLGFPHVVTSKYGWNSRVIRDFPERILPAIGQSIGCEQAAYLTQVHGGRVLQAEGPGRVGEADALFTRRRELALIGKSADCPLVLIADRQNGLVGFAHASWRSTVAGVVPNLLGQMIAAGARPDSLVACIAPSIGPDCYEVGPEVRAAALEQMGDHAAAFFRPGPRKDHFDLWHANSDALLRMGVLQKHIHVAGLCTACHVDLFPSYRRENTEAGRFVAAIGLL